MPHAEVDRFCCIGSFVCGGGRGKTPNHSTAAAAQPRQPQAVSCERVNDDVVDCADGSDEAGTSAASRLVRTGHFVFWKIACTTPTNTYTSRVSFMTSSIASTAQMSLPPLQPTACLDL